jgi:hypothetical protein
MNIIFFLKRFFFIAIFIVISFLFSFNLFSNPFNISSSLEKENYAYQDEYYYKLSLNVSSLKKHDGFFYLRISLPKSIELIEGALFYKDKLASDNRKNINLIINPLKESEGSISLTLFSYIDENTINRSSAKIFIIDYIIFKHNDGVLLLKANEIREFIKEKTNNLLKNEEKIDFDFNIDESKVLDELENLEKNNLEIKELKKNKQTFIFVKKSNNIIYLKYFLFLISLFIVVYFINRIIKNNSKNRNINNNINKDKDNNKDQR